MSFCKWTANLTLRPPE